MSACACEILRPAKFSSLQYVYLNKQEVSSIAIRGRIRVRVRGAGSLGNDVRLLDICFFCFGRLQSEKLLHHALELKGGVGNASQSESLLKGAANQMSEST